MNPNPPAPDAVREQNVEVQWEVWQDDMMVAVSDSEADARHYLMVYGQDGPATLVRAITIRQDIAKHGSKG